MKSRGEKKLIDSKEFSKEIAEQYRSYCTYVTMSATAQNDGYARAAREREIEKWRSRADQANADRDAVQRALLRKNEELLQHLHQGHQKDITITDRAPELPRLRTIEGGVSMKIGSPSSAKASSVVRCEAPEGGEPSERRAEFFENFSLSDMRPLEFPAADEPLVSIILPVFNKWRYTYHCLKSILESTTAATPYEVIIADDRSTDETAAMLSRLKGAHIVTNASTLGFLKNCNAAANQAKGAHLLFLNSDTEVGADWLLRLTEVMKNESVGAVGAKLIFPNGTLQEAGCIVWSDGTTAGYGRGENPCKPEFCYLRDVDYCSGACLLVRKDLFFGLGGFDETYAPAYYEDADLCFAIRNAGYRVVYQPRSEVVHHETVSTILDDAVQLSSENRAQFVRKWSHLLAGHAASRPGNILLARDSARGLRVLVVGDAIPGATTLLRRLSELRCRVSFLSFTHVRAHQPGMTEFQMMGIEMLCGEGIDVKRLMEERKGFYDVIIVSRRHDDARLLMELRRRFHTVRIIYDAGAFYDLGEMNTRRFDGPVPAGDKRREMLEAEIKLLGHADLVIVASENERDHMEALGCDNVVVWSGSTDAKTPQRLRDDLRQIIEGQDKETAGPSRQEENGFGQEVQPLPQEAFNADIAIGKASPTLRAGSAVYVPARVGNVSPVSWPAHRLRDGSSAISLSYHWLHADGTEALHDGDRTGLPCEVNPGEEIPMTAEVKVPDRPGKYILVFDMLQERVAWFEEKGSKTVRLEITVT
jgi:GT2 family glycosyltransferase